MFVDSRTPGRRYWEAHRFFTIGTILSLFLLASSLWFLFGRVRALDNLRPHNPHYETDHCFDCHEARNSKMTSSDCYKCHDSETRELLPNAIEDRLKLSPDAVCFHPLKTIDAVNGRSITSLCFSCHATDRAFVAFTNIETGGYIEIDISLTHPIGLRETASIRAKTLPTNQGIINCVTCHDPHSRDKRLHLLRLYHPGNGRPADFRPLCLDCHEEGWMPLGPKVTESVREAHKLREALKREH